MPPIHVRPIESTSMWPPKSSPYSVLIVCSLKEIMSFSFERRSKNQLKEVEGK